MAELKKVRVCKKCSGFDVAELKGKAEDKGLYHRLHINVH